MTKRSERLAAFAFGVLFVVILLVLALFVPNPTAFQYTVFRVVLALAAAGAAAMIPGFLEVQVAQWIRAGGALAVFVIVFFYNPAQLVTHTEPLERLVTLDEGTYDAFDLLANMGGAAGGVVIDPKLALALKGKTFVLTAPLKRVKLKSVLDQVFAQTGVAASYVTDEETVTLRLRGGSA
jgi:energy-coupling factor transporter transmembrane protein EcfT